MIQAKSRITGEITHHQIKLDLLSKGWLPIDAALEQPFDIIIDMGLISDKREFQTIQVKSWKTLKTCSRPQGGVEKVSEGGKERNSYWYYDEGIDWIATVNYDNIVMYWSRELYQYKSSGQLKKTTPIEFPNNDEVYAYRKPLLLEPTNSSLSSFIKEAA